jgi:hypothetical protein
VSTIKELHREAMERTDLALAAQRAGDAEKGQSLLRTAYELESQAAHLASQKPDSEPTKSILYRSAASIALDCGLNREAERLICEALRGNPPDAIANELRDLLEKVNFGRHLELHGVSLAETEVQMSLTGNAIGLGIAPVGELLPRIYDAEKLVYRTAERLSNLPFRSSGRIPASILNNVALFTSVPRAASFAVSLRVGQSAQMKIAGTSSLGEETIDDLLECLELFNKGNEEQLKRRIPQEDYYVNFVGLARNIAPDGNDVTLVGFSAVRDGIVRTVSLTNQGASEIRLTPIFGVAALQAPDGEEAASSIQGILKEADSRDSKRGKIHIIDKDGASHTVIVPPGMMADIVKPLWESEVVITGDRKRRLIHLTDIRPVKAK